MRNFDKIDKEFLKKKLDYREYSMTQQSDLFGLDQKQLQGILRRMKEEADATYFKKEFSDAIELYMKGGFSLILVN
jgi:DNA polymerase III sliding clamp (beta) subunit (PCNA family)